MKAKLLSDAEALSRLADALNFVNTDTGDPVAAMAGNFLAMDASSVDENAGLYANAIQYALSLVESTMDLANLNPISLTLTVAGIIDTMAAILCKKLAEDPPSGEFTTVFEVPDWPFGDIAGVSAAGNTLLVESWELLQAVANALAASERYQGAVLAGDTASQALQETAFNTALDAYEAQRGVVSAHLDMYLAELQQSVSDIVLADSDAFTNLQNYLQGLGNPLTENAFLADFIASVGTAVPGLNGLIDNEVVDTIVAILAADAPILPGTAFSAIRDAADTLAGAGESTVQGFYIALFNRPADPFGLAFWEGLTSNGADLSVLINGDPSRGIGSLTSVPEYTARFAGLGNSEVVNSIFQSLFGRDGDAGGLAFYVSQLESGAQNIETIAINIYDGAQGLDLATLINKEMAANKFTGEIDTQAEIDAYNSSTIGIARAHLTGVTDDLFTIPTFVEAAAAVQAMVGASVGLIGASAVLHDI